MSAADNKIWFQIRVFLRLYAAWNGSLLPTFRVKLSVPYSRVQQSQEERQEHLATLCKIPEHIIFTSRQKPNIRQQNMVVIHIWLHTLMIDNDTRQM